MTIDPFAPPTVEQLDVLTRMLALVSTMELSAETQRTAPAGATIYPWLDDPSQWGSFRHEGTET
jgi:hypothetical protein